MLSTIFGDSDPDPAAVKPPEDHDEVEQLTERLADLRQRAEEKADEAAKHERKAQDLERKARRQDDDQRGRERAAALREDAAEALQQGEDLRAQERDLRSQAATVAERKEEKLDQAREEVAGKALRAYKAVLEEAKERTREAVRAHRKMSEMLRKFDAIKRTPRSPTPSRWLTKGGEHGSGGERFIQQCEEEIQRIESRI